MNKQDAAKRVERSHAAKQQRRREQLEYFVIRQINRQLRDPEYREQLADKVIKGGLKV